MQRDAVLNVRLPLGLKRALAKAAQNDFDRSSSGMVVRILREWLVANEYLAAEPARSKRTKKEK